jgi:putative ABC transport system permease protein
MSPGSCLRVALAAISKNRLQTALTMIGLMIGVATVLTMIALGSGAQTAIQDQVKSAGMNLVVVTPGNHTRKLEDESGMMDDPGSPEELQASVALADAAGETVKTTPSMPEEPPPVSRGTATLSMSDADAIREVAGVQYVSQGVHDNTRLTVGDKQVFTRLHGDDTSLPLIRRAWKFSAGRFYTEGEQKGGGQVVVLGSVVAQKLFAGDSAVGQTITLLNKPFKVIGVVGSGNWMVAAASGDDQFDAVYVPYTTLQKLLGLASLNDISATAASSGDVTRVVKGITELLRKRHKISPAQQDDFTVTSQARKALATGGMRPEVAHAVVGNVNGLEKVTLAELSKTLDRASRTMTALLASVAAVSLLVGGIGIMNVMLLSVTERTKEIGIRRAIGARSKDVLLQFLMEATTLSLAGGVAGIVLGVLISIAISRWATWTASVSGVSVALSFGVAAMVGIFFGYYPARRAAEVAPMESLRYE